jgi:DNA-directed RNA polymerase specialized sigma24 family protein
MDNGSMDDASEVLKACRKAAVAARRSSGLADESGQVISLDDHAHEVWLRFQKQTAKEAEDGKQIESQAAMLRTIARSVLIDHFRKLERIRKTQTEFESVAETDYVSRDREAATEKLGVLLGELGSRERLTLAYYLHNGIEFPNNVRTVLDDGQTLLDQHARDLQISKAALKKSLSRIRAVAAELGEGFLDDGSAAATPFMFNDDDFLTIAPHVDHAGRLSLTIGLPASLSEPESRKAPERKLLEESVFHKLLPASVSYAFSGLPEGETLDKTLAELWSVSAGLAATQFQLVRSQALQLLARLMIDSGRFESQSPEDHAATNEKQATLLELLDEFRRTLESDTVKVSPRAVDLHATLHELEERSTAVSSR